jgi:hypothetical protein
MPSAYAASPATIIYDDAVAVPGAEFLAEDLANSGLLSRRFFDALRVCPNCDSARLNIRQECSRCRSPTLLKTLARTSIHIKDPSIDTVPVCYVRSVETLSIIGTPIATNVGISVPKRRLDSCASTAAMPPMRAR